MDSREKKSSRHHRQKETPKEKSAAKKKFNRLLEKKSTSPRRAKKSEPSVSKVRAATRRDDVADERKGRKKSRTTEETSPSRSTRSAAKCAATDSVPLTRLSTEGRDQISRGSGQPSPVKDYIRNTITLPHMNNTAEEFILDGFALVAFKTKEDLDTFITEKEGKPVGDRLKQQLHHRKRTAHELGRRKMGEEKARHRPRRSLSGTREKRPKKKLTMQSPKDHHDTDDQAEESSSGRTKPSKDPSPRGNDAKDGIGPVEGSTADAENPATATVHKTTTATPTKNLDSDGGDTEKKNSERQVAAHTLSLLSSGGLKRELLTPILVASLTSPVKSETTETEVDGGDPGSLKKFRSDSVTEDLVVKAEENANEVRKVKVGQNDDGAISHSSSATATVQPSTGIISSSPSKRESTRSPSPQSGEVISTPTSSQDSNRTAADSSQRTTHSTGPVITANNTAGGSATSGSSTGGPAVETASSSPPADRASSTEKQQPQQQHRHKEKKSHHRERGDRDRCGERDRDRSERHRDKDRERDKDKDREKGTPRPDSRQSASSKADNHNPASQKGFNPVIQSQNPLTQHLFHSPSTPLSPPFPSSSSSHHSIGGPGGGGGGSGPAGIGGVIGGPGSVAGAGLFSHLNFQQPNWRMFSSAMMGAAAGGMPGGMPMGLMGPAGFDRSFFGFPPYTPGAPSFPGAGMGNGMSASANPLLSSSMSSPFPPSMSGMNGLPMPNFPGLNGLPPNFPNPQTSSAGSATSPLNSAVLGPKKPGKWCAMHVRIAWEIYHHQARAAQQNSTSAEGIKMGDFSGERHMMKSGPSISLNLTGPGLSPGFYSRPGAPSDLASSLMSSSLQRMPSQPAMSWPPRPPFFGLPSPGGGLGGLGFPANPMMNRDVLSPNFSATDWRRPMAFGGLANPATAGLNNPVNGSSTAQSSGADRKECLPDKKPDLSSPVESRDKRPATDESDREQHSSSSSKKKRTESDHRASKSPSVNNSDKQHGSSKEVGPSPDREKKRDREREEERKRSTETTPRDGKKHSSSSASEGSAVAAAASNSKAIDLRNRTESVSASAASNPPERTKSAVPVSTSQTASLLSGPSPHPPSFPGDSPFPSFMASQLNGSGFDGRHGSPMFPSAPGFSPMWPNYDPLRPPNLGADPLMAQMFQYQRMRAAGGPMPFSPDMFRPNPFMPQLSDRDRMNMNDMATMMRFKAGGFSPGPPGSLFPSPLTASLMRGGGSMMDPGSMYSPGMVPFDPSASSLRRSPTPAKSSSSSSESQRKDLTGGGGGGGATQNGGKDSPTDLSKSRSSNHGQGVQSQSGKESSSSTSSKSSKGGHHRHSPVNGDAATKLDKERN